MNRIIKAIGITIALFAAILGYVAAMSINGMPDWYYSVLFLFILAIPICVAVYLALPKKEDVKATGDEV